MPDALCPASQASFCRLLRVAKFLKRPQECDRVIPAQHADYTSIPDDGHLVDAISIHLLEGGPQLGVRIDAFGPLEGKHDLRDARHPPFAAGHLLDAMQGDEADRVVSAVDEESSVGR